MTPADNCTALRLANQMHALHCKREECAGHVSPWDLREFLVEAIAYFDDRADASQEPGYSLQGNEAMRLLVRAQELQAQVERGLEGKA